MNWPAVCIGALMDMRAQPLRTFAIVLGLATAIAAVVLADASNRISTDANQVYAERTFGREATFLVGPNETVNLSEHQQRLASQQMEDILLPGTQPVVSRYSSVPLELPGETGSVWLTARWVTVEYADVVNVDMISGSWPGISENALAPRVVLTQDGVSRLGLSAEQAPGTVLSYFGGTGAPLDQRMRLRYPMVISGVATNVGRTQESIEALIVSSAPSLPGLATIPRNWLVHGTPADQFAIEHAVHTVMTGTDPSVAFTVRRMDSLGEIKPVLDQQAATSRILSGIILAVAGIGVIGVGLSNIKQRAQEFGIRRALGVTTREVFAGVVVQTLFEAMIAATVAVVGSALVIIVVGDRLVLVDIPLPGRPALPWSSAMFGISAAMTIGVVASLLPAARAARYSIAQVLRA